MGLFPIMLALLVFMLVGFYALIRPSELFQFFNEMSFWTPYLSPATTDPNRWYNIAVTRFLSLCLVLFTSFIFVQLALGNSEPSPSRAPI